MKNAQAANKGYVDGDIAKIPRVDPSQFVLTSGGTLTGDLVLDNMYQYPIHGDLKKVINYANIRDVFLSRKETAKMETNLDMNNNLIENVKDPANLDHGANKKYIDQEVSKLIFPPTVDETQFLKLDGTRPMAGILNMSGHKIEDLGTPSPNEGNNVTNVSYVKNALEASRSSMHNDLDKPSRQKIKRITPHFIP